MHDFCYHDEWGRQMTLKEAFGQLVKESVDLKYQLVLISTVLVYSGYMDDKTWAVFVLSVTGFRMATDIANMVNAAKGVKNESKD